MAPEHVRKRQYQPSNQTKLNSYFGGGAGERAQSPLTPPLPPDVQSSLISVGMRVRKSVPEGYKTHKTGLSGFPFPSSAPSATPTPPTSSAPLRPSNRPDRTRELLPFCGLHRTGGWAAQEIPSSSAPAALAGGLSYEEGSSPGSSLCRSTTQSTQNSFLAGPPLSGSMSNKKRGYEDEVEDEMDAFFDEEELSDAAVDREPRTLRSIARMKTASTMSAMKVQPSAVRIIDPEDFEEASFLVPMEIE